jgi:type I restriction enzyme S subunit
VPFGDVFDLVKGDMPSGKVVEDEDGESVFINLSNKQIYKKTNYYSLEGENIFISNTSPLGLIQYFNGKCCYSNLLERCLLKDNYKLKINLKYIYYYLKNIQSHLETTYNKGSCNQSLDIKNFNRMKIPIPSLDVQRAYVKSINDAVGKSLELSNFNPNLQKLSYIETLSNTIKHSDVKELFELALKKQIKLPTTQWVPFGDVFDLVKGELQSSKVEEDEDGDGVLINWSIYDNYKKINNPTLNGENLFISTAMPNGKSGQSYIVIKYYNGKCSYCDLLSRCVINTKYNNNINLKYISYYLEANKNYLEITYEKGSCNKSLDIKNFNRMKIPIPPIEAQNEIVAEINEVEAIAERWKRDIEYLKNKKGNRMLDMINLDKPLE